MKSDAAVNYRLRVHSGLVCDLLTNRAGRRRAALRRYTFDLIGMVVPYVAAVHDGMTFIVSTRDKTVGRDTFVGGAYELDVMDRAMDILAGSGHPLAGRTFVDVGANIGTSTIPALLKHGARRAVAFEPDPSNAALLRSNAALNKLATRVVVHEMAVSEAPGEMTLYLSAKNHGDHRLVASPDEVRQGVRVRVTTLDEALGDERDIAVIWMDTQGHEASVLDGAKQLLGRGVPVVAELWPSAHADGGRRLADTVKVHFRFVIDVRGTGKRMPIAEFGRLIERYRLDLSDVILLP